MKFVCEVAMDNAAFQGNTDELKFILYDIAYDYAFLGKTESSIYDSNGNKVGQWEIKESDND